jgi:Trk-type K+ transport system membrane component
MKTEKDITQNQIEKDECESRKMGVKIIDKVLFRYWLHDKFLMIFTFIFGMILFVFMLLLFTAMYDKAYNNIIENVKIYCINNNLTYETCRQIVYGIK